MFQMAESETGRREGGGGGRLRLGEKGGEGREVEEGRGMAGWGGCMITNPKKFSIRFSHSEFFFGMYNSPGREI